MSTQKDREANFHDLLAKYSPSRRRIQRCTKQGCLRLGGLRSAEWRSCKYAPRTKLSMAQIITDSKLRSKDADFRMLYRGGYGFDNTSVEKCTRIYARKQPTPPAAILYIRTKANPLTKVQYAPPHNETFNPFGENTHPVGTSVRVAVVYECNGERFAFMTGLPVSQAVKQFARYYATEHIRFQIDGMCFYSSSSLTS